MVAAIETTFIVTIVLALETISTLAWVRATMLIASIYNPRNMAVMYLVALFHQNTMISLSYLRRKMFIANLNIVLTIVQLT
mgnify:CR=1 FL=1